MGTNLPSDFQGYEWGTRSQTPQLENLINRNKLLVLICNALSKFYVHSCGEAIALLFLSDRAIIIFEPTTESPAGEIAEFWESNLVKASG